MRLSTNCLTSLKLSGPIVAVPDLHMPFHSRKFVKWQLAAIKETAPAYVVQVGDLYDILFASRFYKSLNIMTPRQELKDGRRYAEDFWNEVKVKAPKAKRIQLRGNHEERVDKRLMESAPYLEDLTDLEGHSRFEGVQTIQDAQQELLLGEVFLQHGYMNFGRHAVHNQAPTICGHSHHGGVALFQNRHGIYWELNAGFGGDRKSPVFNYRTRRIIDGWTLGCGIVDELGPRFAVASGCE